MLSMLPNDALMALHSSVLGSEALGLRFCQKIEWLMCPPPLNLMAGASDIAVLKCYQNRRMLCNLLTKTKSTLEILSIGELSMSKMCLKTANKGVGRVVVGVNEIQTAIEKLMLNVVGVDEIRNEGYSRIRW